jgi:hypothetical protein
MKSTIKEYAGYIGIVLFLLLVVFLIDISGLAWQSFIGPKRENVRREIFEETKSYNEGKEQDLIRYRLQYMKAEGKEKEAIGSTIRMMFADYDENKLSPELRDFLKEIKYGEY